jgi:hypothetical protein
MLRDVIFLFVIKFFLGIFLGVMPTSSSFWYRKELTRRDRTVRFEIKLPLKQMSFFRVILRIFKIILNIFWVIIAIADRGFSFVIVLMITLFLSSVLFYSFSVGFMTGLPVAIGFLTGMVWNREDLVLLYHYLTEKIILDKF